MTKYQLIVAGFVLIVASFTACGTDNNSHMSINTVSSTISLGSSTSGNSTYIGGFTVNSAGTITASAVWTGTTNTLALILNGPGQVGYYARNDGISPNTISYNVTSADINKGSLWQISVINFYNGDASGIVTIEYPN